MSNPNELRRVRIKEFLFSHDEDIENRFLADLRLRNGVYKHTYRNRLDDVNQITIEALGSPTGDVLRLLDVGCSSGVSTVELHQALKAQGHLITTIGTDLVVDVYYLRGPNGDGLLLDNKGQVLRIEIYGEVYSWESLQAKTNHLLSLKSPRRTARLGLMLIRARLSRNALSRLERVPLIASIVKETKDLEIVEEDVFLPREIGKFDIIRAANLLNDVYFNAEEIKRICTVLLQRLRPGGILVIARTLEPEGKNQATVFRLIGNCLRKNSELAGGTEVASVLESITVSNE